MVLHHQYFVHFIMFIHQREPPPPLRGLNGRCDSVYLHFIHLYVLLVQGKLEVGVIGRWSELVARQHKKDQSRHFHQKLKKHECV